MPLTSPNCFPFLGQQHLSAAPDQLAVRVELVPGSRITVEGERARAPMAEWQKVRQVVARRRTPPSKGKLRAGCT